MHFSSYAYQPIDTPKQYFPIPEFASDLDSILWNSEYNRQVKRGASVTAGIEAADEFYTAWKARSAKLKSL